MVLRVFQSCALRNFVRNSSNRNAVGGANLVEKVISTPDNKMFLAWHPNLDFPYEYSKPIPTLSEVELSSLVKEKAINTAMRAFKDRNPEVARQELMSLTHTTKHRWFPRSRDKKAKKTSMDREFL